MKHNTHRLIVSIMILSFIIVNAILAFETVAAMGDELEIQTSNEMGNWYACQNGNYQAACDAIDADQAPAYSDALGNWYACHSGNYQAACDAINVEQAPAYSDALGDWYACVNGFYHAACDAIEQAGTI